MINSELRIGNIVYYKNYSYSVIGIGLTKAVLDNGITVNIKALKGMKIIPDILTLLGFDDVTPLIIAGMGQKIYRRDGVVLVYYPAEMCVEYMIYSNTNSEGLTDKMSKVCQYVHDLQNLHYSLWNVDLG